MTEKETMKQSADAANAESLTERARRLLQEAQDLLEQVRQREQARPLTAEELEQRIEPLLSTLVMVAQLDVSQLERATEATTKAAQEAHRLRYDMQTAGERAQEAAETWRGSVNTQAGWLMALSALAGLIGALLIVGFLLWGGGLKPPSVYLDCQRVQQELQRQALPRR